MPEATPVPAPAAPTVPEAAPAAPAVEKEVFKIKADKEEVTLELTPEEKAELVRKGYTFDKRLSELDLKKQEMTKMYNELVKAIKTDPINTLKHDTFGVDVEKLVADQIYARMQAEMEAEELANMEPEKRELVELRKKQQTWQQREAEEAQKAEQARATEEEKRLQAEYEGAMAEELAKLQLPDDIKKNTSIPMRQAIYLESLLREKGDAGLTREDFAQATQAALNGLKREIKGTIAALPVADLVKWLGEDKIAEIRKTEIAKVVKEPAKTEQADTGKIIEFEEGGKKYRIDISKNMTGEEWDAYMQHLKKPKAA